MQMNKRSRRSEGEELGFLFCDIPLCRQTDGPALLHKNNIIWWARYLEHLLRVSSLAESITLNFPTWEQRETLYINRRALSCPTAGVEYSSSRSGSSFYESFSTPTLLTSPSLPTCLPSNPPPPTHNEPPSASTVFVLNLTHHS